jgi:hypothetical protein
LGAPERDGPSELAGFGAGVAGFVIPSGSGSARETASTDPSVTDPTHRADAPSRIAVSFIVFRNRLPSSMVLSRPFT